MNEVIKNILERRSVRKYTQKKIDKKDLDLILQAACYAPSGKNTQSRQFTVVQDEKKLTELNEAVRKVQNRDLSYNCFYNAPALVIVSGPEDNPLSPLDCACALENIFLAAQSLSIASCWINQIGQTCTDPSVRTILDSLGVPEDHAVYGSAALGYAQAAPVEPLRRQGTVKWV